MKTGAARPTQQLHPIYSNGKRWNFQDGKHPERRTRTFLLVSEITTQQYTLPNLALAPPHKKAVPDHQSAVVENRQANEIPSLNPTCYCGQREAPRPPVGRREAFICMRANRRYHEKGRPRNKEGNPAGRGERPTGGEGTGRGSRGSEGDNKE